MKTLTKWFLVALTSVAIVGCDPFEEASTAAPVVTGAGATDTSAGVGYSGTLAGSTWTVAAPATCVGPGQAELAGFIWVKFNVLLDGQSIQSGPSPTIPNNDCTPAAAEGFVGTPANPGGDDWYTCYNPQSPTPDEGPSVIIFLDPPAPAPSGWIGADPLPGDGDAVISYTTSGTVRDTQGRTASYDVALDVTPDPGVPGTPTYTNVTATSADVSWTASDCSTTGTTSYLLERAPDNGGTPGTFAAVTTTANLTYSDSGLTTGTLYWYRVTAETSAPGNFFGAASPAASNPNIPGAPTFTSVTTTSLTVNWTASDGAASYNVQRAQDVAGAPGTFANIATGLTALTYNDTGLTTATTYWYRVIAVNALASATGGAASVTTL